MDVDLQHRTDTAMRTIGCYDRYADAQAVVDGLSDDGFPVEQLTIVGRDLRIVEHVTGRLNTWRAALGGAGAGAAIGFFLGLLFGLLFAPDGLSLVAALAYWTVVSAIVGAVLGFLAHLATGGRRDFSSVSGIEATHYEVLATDTAADEAERRIGALARR